MSDLRKLLDEATPGPWHVERDKQTWGWVDVVGPSFSVGGPTRATDLSLADEAKRLADARLIAMAPDLAAALLKAEEALANIASQKKTDEIETEYEAECADFEAGFDTCVDVARSALTEIRKLTGGK